MKTFQVTIGATPTVISSSPLPFSAMCIQNNAGHACRVGDSTVTNTVATSPGIELGNGTPGTPFWVQPGIPGYSYDASQWYIGGTQNDKIDVLVI